jgi:hypothetical protein
VLLPRLLSLKYSNQQNRKFKALAKEAAGTLTVAYANYKLNNQTTTTMYPSDLFVSINYTRLDTSSSMDGEQTQGASICASPGAPCIRLHNGAMVMAWDVCGHFGGSGTTNAVWYQIDLDGAVTDGTTNGPGKSVVFALYHSGRLATYGTLAANSTSQSCPIGADATRDPPWFNWD